MIAASAYSSSAWTFGASILSFTFPMLLFIVVAAWLYVTYTKPELSPGHRHPGAERPAIYTKVPGKPKEADGESGESKARTEGGA